MTAKRPTGFTQRHGYNFMTFLWRRKLKTEWKQLIILGKDFVFCKTFQKLVYLSTTEFEIMRGNGRNVVVCIRSSLLSQKSKWRISLVLAEPIRALNPTQVPVLAADVPTVLRGRQSEDTLWQQHCSDVIIFLKCWLLLPRAQHLCWTQILCPGH